MRVRLHAAVTIVVREAIGVVGLVLPWNFPLLMLAWKIAPSLAAGCSIVVKPAKETTLSALRVAELAHEGRLYPPSSRIDFSGHTSVFALSRACSVMTSPEHWRWPMTIRSTV